MYSVAFAKGFAADRVRKTGTVIFSVLAASLLLSQSAPAQSGLPDEGQSIQITPEPNRLGPGVSGRIQSGRSIGIEQEPNASSPSKIVEEPPTYLEGIETSGTRRQKPERE
jgi:hypothetical protein